MFSRVSFINGASAFLINAGRDSSPSNMIASLKMDIKVFGIRLLSFGVLAPT